MSGSENVVRTQMDVSHVHEVASSAERELLLLLEQRAGLMKRIGTIKQTLAGLANMFGDTILSERCLDLLERKTARQSGFTQACRAVLMESPTQLTVRQACDQLVRKFPGLLERHRKPLSSVTTVLARLVEYGEAHTFLTSDGRRVWQWVSERERGVGGVTLAPEARVFARPQGTA